MALNTHNSTTTTIKFLCSYGGKILPRYPDGKLRYHGGQTRVLAVHRSISFSELLVKLGELCGTSATLRCQLPTEDLDALVSITSDEDLVNLIEEYDHQSTRQSKSLKIRAFLSPPKRSSPSPSPSPSRSTASGSSSSISTTTHDAGSPKSPLSSAARSPDAAGNRCIYHVSKPPVPYNRSAGKMTCYAYGNPSRSYLVHHGNYWQ
ncbi:putative PB1 domain-containing protein [Helianthus annuus]|uniref:PB1 domain-containing protein n=1 Tax=Helianthus annuus TaxID=4232 RepID=A0A251T2F3_HELAN|nr:uncharacterized protein LOC110895090 isoform X1 [Helianthus annuus]KAF5778203.1 putative PB1 domain-containing protein [Helianthus annuus]KAJ0862967.1 putative PB1 domain-containing protein [Helianthus annuus]KAJ0866813.1 putative PB1 domain-containing protein [Helianthus annuus]